MSKVYCTGQFFLNNTPIGCGKPDCRLQHNWNDLKHGNTDTGKQLKFVDAGFCIHNGHCHYKQTHSGDIHDETDAMQKGGKG